MMQNQTLKKHDIEIGMKFNRWVVIGDKTVGENGEEKYLCRCSCGTERYVLKRSLIHNGSKSCGCLRREKTAERNTKILQGQVFGELTVLSKAEYQRKNGGIWWTCRCSCGELYDVPGTLLITGRRQHCGGKSHKRTYFSVDITEQKFGDLTALHATQERDSKGSIIWQCRCSCGNLTKVSYNHLLYSNQKSCGCRKKAHGQNLNRYLTHVAGTSIDGLKSKKIPTDNTTGYKGVYFVRGKYIAKIVFQKKAYYLGTYASIEEAARVRKEAEEVLFDGVAAFYEKWNQRAKEDPAWAEEHPIEIKVSKDESGQLQIALHPLI